MPIAKGDAMTAPLSAERVIELREQIRTGAVVIWSPDISGVADIINIVERYSAMRAEMENLEGQLIDYAWLNGELLESKKKAEAALEKVCARNKLMDETFGSLLEKNINLEAELAKVAPLIEAAMEAIEFGIHWTMEGKGWDDGVDAILREALKLREEKK